MNLATILKPVAPALVMLVLVAACASTSRPYLPSEDPLVLEAFERSLTAEHIPYTRDLQGRYEALNASDQGRLETLGERARQLDTRREQMRLTLGCASRKLRAYLRGTDALYVLDRREDGTYLVMVASDFGELDVARRYGAFQRECEE
ncbi:MAG: hypothetical protein U5K56_03325 [Halioglobus sp.]|nr:hypothetical protein [Halioglobus sp.]